MQKTRSDRYAEVPETCNKQLEELVAPHVDSFNFFLDEGLRLIVNDLDKYELIVGPEGNKKTFYYWIEEVRVGKPIGAEDGRRARVKVTTLIDRPVYPMEVRFQNAKKTKK